MIRNQLQLEVAKTQLANFRDHLRLLEKETKTGRGTAILRVEESAVRETIRELESLVLEYESLWDSKRPTPTLHSMDDLPKALVEARLSLGITQKGLAERAGLKQEQIESLESSNFYTATFAQIRKLVRILNVRLSDSLGFLNEDLKYGDLLEKIKSVGLDHDFVYGRILPPEISMHISQVRKDDTLDVGGGQAIEYLSRVFPISREEFFGHQEVVMDTATLGNVRFKLRKGYNKKRTTAYTFYAHYLALRLLQATDHLPIKAMPTDPYRIHTKIVEDYGSFSLEGSLRFIWNLGIPVMTVNDPGAFQGAFFKENDRGIILLKSKTKSHARWSFDLFHEYWHATRYRGDTKEIFEIEDFKSESLGEKSSSKEETEASLFASAVLLGRRPDTLVHMCMKEARNDLSRLKRAVRDVAARENVSVDALANCVAFRLSKEGHDWWGSAERLQSEDESISSIVNKVLIDFVDLNSMAAYDLDLLKRALDGVG